MHDATLQYQSERAAVVTMFPDGPLVNTINAHGRTVTVPRGVAASLLTVRLRRWAERGFIVLVGVRATRNGRWCADVRANGIPKRWYMSFEPHRRGLRPTWK